MLNISQSGWRVGKCWMLVGCRSWLLFRRAFFSIHCCMWELLFVLSTSYLPSSQPTTKKKMNWLEIRSSKGFLVILTASETISLLFMTSGHLSYCVSIYFYLCPSLQMHSVGTAYGENVPGDKTICLRTVCTIWETLIKLKSPRKPPLGHLF